MKSPAANEGGRRAESYSALSPKKLYKFVYFRLIRGLKIKSLCRIIVVIFFPKTTD